MTSPVCLQTPSPVFCSVLSGLLGRFGRFLTTDSDSFTKRRHLMRSRSIEWAMRGGFLVGPCPGCTRQESALAMSRLMPRPR